MSLRGERLEVRIVSFKGRTIHRDKANMNNQEHLARLFRVLDYKFNIDLEKMIKLNKHYEVLEVLGGTTEMDLMKKE